MTIDANTGLILWTPTDIGDVNVTVLATNAGGSDSQSFTITVAAVPPVITSSAVTDVNAGNLYSYDTYNLTSRYDYRFKYWPYPVDTDKHRQL
jgi:PKD repeat protein